MKKQEILEKLSENYRSFGEMIAGLSENDFTFSKPGKWTAGQQLEHLCKSVKPLARGLLMPTIGIAAMFGKSERPSISYEELVKNYQAALAAGGRATGRFVPSPVEISRKETLQKELIDTVESLSQRIGKFGEDDLDKLLLPHPLLGKLTLREMLMFMIYHAEHHHKSALANLGR